MSKSTNVLNNILHSFARDNARYAKRMQRDSVALLDVLASDDDFAESFEMNDIIAREANAHSH